MTRDQLIVEALKLDPTELEALLEDLWQRVGAPDLTSEQVVELHRRIQAVDRGEMRLIPGDAVMTELRERFSRA